MIKYSRTICQLFITQRGSFVFLFNVLSQQFEVNSKSLRMLLFFKLFIVIYLLISKSNLNQMNYHCLALMYINFHIMIKKIHSYSVSPSLFKILQWPKICRRNDIFKYIHFSDGTYIFFMSINHIDIKPIKSEV